VPPLLAAGFEVHAVLSPAAAHGVPAELAGAQVHRADLLAADGAAGLLSAVRPSHLLHFAWIATPGIYQTSADNARWLQSSRALLDAFTAGGGGRAVIAGTCAEYAPAGAAACVERRTPLIGAAGEAAAPYAACKLALHRDLEDGRWRGLSSAWGRIFLQYGPAEHPDRLVPAVIRSLLASRPAEFSHGRQVRGFLHVADVGGAFAALLDSGVEGPVNVGSDRSTTIGGVVDLIAAQIGRPDLVRRGARPAPDGEAAVLVADGRRLRDEVGWSPRFALEDGLADTVAWWRRELGR
jgi:nucleoside-diphosphate-sugar epimerase